MKIFTILKIKGGSGAQRLFSTQMGAKIGLVYPDFIGRNQKYRIIGDAKYKPIQNIGIEIICKF